MEKDQQREQFETSGEHIEDQDDLRKIREMRVVLGRSDELKSRSDIVDRGGNRGKRSDQALIIDGYEQEGCSEADKECDDIHIYRAQLFSECMTDFAVADNDDLQAFISDCVKLENICQPPVPMYIIILDCGRRKAQICLSAAIGPVRKFLREEDLRKDGQEVHVLLVDGEPEYVHILLHAVLVRGLRDDLDPGLIEEPEQKLGYGTPVLLCHLLKIRLLGKVHAS